MPDEMYIFTLHLKPEWNNDYIGEIDGAVAMVVVDFADAGGALILAQFYAQRDNWKVTDVDEEVSTVNNKNDFAPELVPVYKRAKKEGYAIVAAHYGNGQQ